MATLSEFVRVFGPVKIIWKKKGDNMEITSKVEFKSVKGNRYGFKLNDGNWHSAFLNGPDTKWPTPEGLALALQKMDVGDEAIFSTSQNEKGFWNIKGIEPVIDVNGDMKEKPEPQPSPAPQAARGAERDDIIVNQTVAKIVCEIETAYLAAKKDASQDFLQMQGSWYKAMIKKGWPMAVEETPF